MYLHVIGDTLVRFIKRRFNANDSFVLMQDNAPSHTSNYAMEFFKANSIPVMSWSSTSSDLNPIENIWDIIDDVAKKFKRTLVDDSTNMDQYHSRNHRSTKNLVYPVLLFYKRYMSLYSLEDEGEGVKGVKGYIPLIEK